MTDAAHTPYATLERQHEADRLGMMGFVASEAMLFGALIAAILVLNFRQPVTAAATSAKLNLWLGGANTAVLLTSSLLVAIGVTAGERAPRRTAPFFGGAALLGLAFLAIKATEYASEYREGLMPGTAPAHFDDGAERLFMNLYFIATGLHALHVTVGIALLVGLAVRARTRRPATHAAVANAGLYWHLVDMIWVFLYPLLYLVRV